jgi:hypothetical protein
VASAAPSVAFEWFQRALEIERVATDANGESNGFHAVPRSDAPHFYQKLSNMASNLEMDIELISTEATALGAYHAG